MSTITLSSVRLSKDISGTLYVHDLARNIRYDLAPSELRSKDVDGIALVLRKFSKILSLSNLKKLAKRMEKEDVNQDHDWEVNWNYLYSLELAH